MCYSPEPGFEASATLATASAADTSPRSLVKLRTLMGKASSPATWLATSAPVILDFMNGRLRGCDSGRRLRHDESGSEAHRSERKTCNRQGFQHLQSPRSVKLVEPWGQTRTNLTPFASAALRRAALVAAAAATGGACPCTATVAVMPATASAKAHEHGFQHLGSPRPVDWPASAPRGARCGHPCSWQSAAS